MHDFFTVKEGNVTYLCNNTEEGVMIIGQKHVDSKHWMCYRSPAYWTDHINRLHTRRMLYEQIEMKKTPVDPAWVTAIFLMGRKETEL